MKKLFIFSLGLVLTPFQILWSQQTGGPWHGIEREMHYKPDGEDFVLVKAQRRFNRALYGGNTAFRVEAGDLPEMALYLPGMGGNLKFGLVNGTTSKWIINADHIETRYRPGSMIYRVKDKLLGDGTITLHVLPLFDQEGLIVKLQATGVPAGVQLITGFGGVTGKKFSRDGDIGADPESAFYLKPEYCKDNIYAINKNAFTVYYGGKTSLSEEDRYEIQHFPKQGADSAMGRADLKTLWGIFPQEMTLKTADPGKQESPAAFLRSTNDKTPALRGQIALSNSPLYFLVQNGKGVQQGSYMDLPSLFDRTERSRQHIANRITIITPDPYINSLGGALSVAADAVWEDPSFMHGAVAWRMRLNGWRGAYAADVLGWHDRARKHFSAYALSQVTTPLNGPVVMDTALHLARGLEKMGTSIFSSGYISRNPGGDQRPHHYDMNLVFVDQLLNHFKWTGDTAYVRQMWPLLQRHLAWEKRNFDRDGDGLYDAYAAIWASDALQYSGGGVAHSSAYNYRANCDAAQLAALIGENPKPYQQEADKILKAINAQLWLNKTGSMAEYKDLLGNQLLHPSAGLWTIYHTLDAYVPTPFQADQMLRYIDQEIPHIPVRAKDLKDTSLYTLATTSWQPYTWSLNNVALGELMHTALAYWQGGRTEEAFRLWKSTLMESMYLGASPGNFQQLSFYDAMRGELYRDFADGIGMTARAVIEGLFGIQPDLLHDTLVIRPGFPRHWSYASLITPDRKIDYRKQGTQDVYRIVPGFGKKTNLLFCVKARQDGIESVMINGKKSSWTSDSNAIGEPVLQLKIPRSDSFIVSIQWKGTGLEKPLTKSSYVAGETFTLSFKKASISNIYDPQQVLAAKKLLKQTLNVTLTQSTGYKTFYIQLKQGVFTYWQPVSFHAVKPIAIYSMLVNGSNWVVLKNNTGTDVRGIVVLNHHYNRPLAIRKNDSAVVNFPADIIVTGTNLVSFEWNGKKVGGQVTDWNKINPSATTYEKIDLAPYFNDQVSSIFKNNYEAPRPNSATLQLPTQGVGNWAYPLTTATIDDSGLRKRAGEKNEIVIRQGIPFTTPSRSGEKNIVFTSQWNNYPKEVQIPLNGAASHAYLLMAGSTNPMQSRLTNGKVVVQYKDGTRDTLELKNPENWWPIEQDYYEDGYAFTTGAAKPVRLYLLSGEDSRTFNKFVTIKGFSNRGIDGGAATVLDLPLNPEKELQSVTLKTVANDVVIGLMSMTLIRTK